MIGTEKMYGYFHFSFSPNESRSPSLTYTFYPYISDMPMEVLGNA